MMGADLIPSPLEQLMKLETSENRDPMEADCEACKWQNQMTEAALLLFCEGTCCLERKSSVEETMAVMEADA